MKRLAVVALGVACAGTYAEDVPSCPPLSLEPTVSRACRDAPEVSAFENLLAAELARRLRGRHPPGLVLRASFDWDAVVESVCLGDGTTGVRWETRARVKRALGPLRELGPGPSCLAENTLDLTSALARQDVRDVAPPESPIPQSGLESCFGLRNTVCTRSSPVCGVFPDGNERTYANACDACNNSFVTGYRPGRCTGGG